MYCPPIYLHFLDNQLNIAAGYAPTTAEIIRIVRLIMLMTNRTTYCGISLLWEQRAVDANLRRLFGEMIKGGQLDLLSPHRTLPEFLYSRHVLYQHDAASYPFYFTPDETTHEDLLGLVPTQIMPEGTTAFLSQHLRQWTEGGYSVKSENELLVERAAREVVSRGLARREDKAITFPLFDGKGESAAPSEVKARIRNAISSQYVRRYMRAGGGDIVTGIYGLSGFDALAIERPMCDFRFLDRLATITGMGSVRACDPIDLLEEVVDILPLRGFGSHGQSTHLLHAITLCLSRYARKVCMSSGEFDILQVSYNQLSEVLRSANLTLAMPSKSLPLRLDNLLSNSTILWNECVRNRELGPTAELIVQDLELLRIDVVIITTTEVETCAVLSTFGFGPASPPRNIDGRGFALIDLGSVSGARVGLLETGMGSGGTAGSQAFVTAMLTSFHPGSIIMVGLAFGVDEQKQSIGDVLVSNQLQQYDHVRIGQLPSGAPQIHPRGDKVTAALRLLNLFKLGIAGWSGARVRLGLLLSGNILVDNLEFRSALLGLWPEAIGGEMEGAGLYAAAPKNDWIIVKAICDWGDGNKAQDKASRQKTAAENAAKFVHHVLLRGGFVRKT